MLYTKQELLNCVFFDIETKPNTDIPDKLMELWKEKFHFRYLEKEIELQTKLASLKYNSSKKHELSQEDLDTFLFENIFIKYAPLQAEFSEVFCISVGMFDEDMNEDVVCICENTEKATLEKLKIFLNKGELILAGFNIKGFDVPYLIKRFLINNIKPPNLLQLRGKKPWDVKMLDLCEDWKGMGWESSSLDLLCNVLNVPSPKTNFKNYEIWEKYYANEITKEDICNYCNDDVKAPMRIAVKLMF